MISDLDLLHNHQHAPSVTPNMLLQQQVHDNKALKGRALKAVYAACIFVAAKRENTPRTFKEICAVMPDVSKVDIGRCFTAIDRCALLQLVGVYSL